MNSALNIEYQALLLMSCSDIRTVILNWVLNFVAEQGS